MDTVKLWHDDVRPAPMGWVWVQNNTDAKAVLSSCDVTEISMDHDLGATPHGEAGIMARGWDEDNGYRLALWMVETGNVPPKITIHSWNPAGAKRMASVFTQAARMVDEVSDDLIVQVIPFDPREHGYV